MAEGSFIRWQSILREQLTYAINLFLGLSVATLGYAVSKLGDNGFAPAGFVKCVFTASLFITLLSIAVGIICVVVRLKNFRLTAQIARDRENRATDARLEQLRSYSQKMDEQTWTLFWWQLGTFSLAVLSMFLSFAGHYGALLW